MTEKKTLHLVPQFHYDVEYLLAVDPYLEVCLNNLVEAHRLLAKHPEYTYLVEQVFLLEQFVREYPGRHEDLRTWAREGRLEVSSGMYAMADINMASGESIMRQLAVGKAWCTRELDCEPRVLNMGDCTGHPAQMPQIAAHCGYDYFVFMRAVDDGSRKSEILWKGIDGTDVRTYWLAAGYAGWYPPRPSGDAPTIETSRVLGPIVDKVVAHSSGEAVILPHGGDFRYPCERAMPMVADWNRAHPDTPIVYSTYSRALDAVDWSRAAPYEGEWNPDRTGCYSSRIRVKQGNRECEALMMTAEAVSALAEVRLGAVPDLDGLLRGWKLTFVNQFHDIIWGTILDEAYQHALERIGRIRTITQNIIEARLHAILDASSEAPYVARAIQPVQPGQDCPGHDERQLVVFNPLPWARKADITVPAKGRVAGMPWREEPGDTEAIRLRLELPPCGFRVVCGTAALGCAASEASAAEPPTTPFTCQEGKDGSLAIETPLYRARLSPSGTMASLVRVKDEIEFVDPARPWFNAICCQTDRGDLWQYYEGPVYDGGGKQAFERDLIDDPYPLEPKFTRNGRRVYGSAADNRAVPAARIAVREISSDRLVISVAGELCHYWPLFREFRQFGMRINYEQTITFRPDDPRIDFHLRTDHERGHWYRLRAAFFTDIRDGRILHEIPFGRFEREQGEFAAQNFMAYCDGEKGVALFNRGLPGNNVTDGVMMLSLMRSVDIHAKVKTPAALEEGETHAFDYAILPFAGEKELPSLDLARQGMEFAVPPYVYERDPLRVSESGGPAIETEDSLVSVEPGSICCTAAYPTEQGIVVRLFESEGAETAATLRLNLDAASAQETDALQRNGRKLELDADGITLAFRPFEIKTILLRR